jgi:ankyrin repeat protein
MQTSTNRRAIAASMVVLTAGACVFHYYTVTRFTKLTPLMTAARAGDADAVERELREGANPNRVWNEGGFRVHGTPRRGVTPLLFAVESGGPKAHSRASVVIPLLAAGADPCVTDNRHGSPLLISVQRRDLEVVRALVTHDRAGCLKAHSAGAMLEVYRALAISPDDQDTWALVEFLIDRVARPGEADHPGALVAAPNPEAQAALQRLIARGVKADGESLVLAAIHRKVELIPWLVEHGADINAPIAGHVSEEAGPPLIRATTSPNAAGLRALIDAGADVNAMDAAGRTALSHLVCDRSCTTRPNPFCETQLESVRLLLDRGARRIGTDRLGDDIAECLRNRPTDPYRADLEVLLDRRDTAD